MCYHSSRFSPATNKQHSKHVNKDKIQQSYSYLVVTGPATSAHHLPSHNNKTQLTAATHSHTYIHTNGVSGRDNVPSTLDAGLKCLSLGTHWRSLAITGRWCVFVDVNLIAAWIGTKPSPTKSVCKHDKNNNDSNKADNPFRSCELTQKTPITKCDKMKQQQQRSAQRHYNTRE